MKLSTRRKWQIGLISIFAIFALTLMYMVRDVLNPFLLGLVLAYILNPIVTWMEKKGAPRKSAVILILSLITVVIIAGSVIITPMIAQETKSWYIACVGEPFVDTNKNEKFDKLEEWTDINKNGKFDKGYIAKLRDKFLKYKNENKNDENTTDKMLVDTTNSKETDKGYIAKLKGKLLGDKDTDKNLNNKNPSRSSSNSFITKIISEEQYNQLIKNIAEGMKNNLNSIISNVQKFTGTALNKSIQAAGWIWQLIFILALTPIYMGFLLYGMDRGWNKFIKYVPATIKPKFVEIMQKINIVIGAFFRGRLLVCLSIGIFTAIGFAILKVKFGIIIGLIIGVASFIPFVNIIPFIIILLISWIDNTSLGGFVAIFVVYGIGQAIDPLLMTLVMGKELELHPVTILLSMFICASLLGFFGMLLAVPIVAICKILFVEFVLPHLKEMSEESTT